MQTDLNLFPIVILKRPGPEPADVIAGWRAESRRVGEHKTRIEEEEEEERGKDGICFLLSLFFAALHRQNR